MPIYQTGYGNLYEFSFEAQTDGTYRAYIVNQPDYGQKDSRSSVVHRLQDGERFYVCWQPAAASREEAKAVAGLWATYTDRYILKGLPFDSPETQKKQKGSRKTQKEEPLVSPAP